VSEHQDPTPRDDTDAVKDIARDLAEVAAQIATFKGEASAYLGDPGYNALRHRLEIAHAAVEAATVEARRRVRLDEGRQVSKGAQKGAEAPRWRRVNEG
jgi:hypothetical protein